MQARQLALSLVNREICRSWKYVDLKRIRVESFVRVLFLFHMFFN